MADHLDSPNLTSPAMDARVDITDLYAFQKPGDASKSILILNVNPLAPTHAEEFRHDARYEILIDTDGDAKQDIVFRIRFSRKVDGNQSARVTRAAREGDNDDDDGWERDEVVEDAPVSFGSDAVITRGRGDERAYRFFAGFRSDPFFFDLAGFLHSFTFTGDDFFKKLNVYGIALEVPNRQGLGGNPKIGVWARTRIPMTMQPQRLTQVDQMGRPAINTVFNHGNDKVLFNSTQPSAMRTTVTSTGKTFLVNFEDTLGSFGYPAAQAKAIAEILLPDILTYDYSSSAGFLNGRRLQDDVIDAELALVTNGGITTDKVGPHTDYLTEFPYLGNPHV